MHVFKEILESAVLTDEVKTQLQEAFDAQVAEKVKTTEVRLATELEEKKQAMATLAMEMIEEAVSEEFTAIREELVEARSMDIRYAMKLEEFKEQYAELKSKELAEMAESTIEAEMGELKESLVEARNNIVGQKMFEAFSEQFGGLVSKEDRTPELEAELSESKKELETLRRENKVNALLEGLTGKKRNVMKTLLADTELDRLEARFEELSESVLSENTGKEEEVLESKEADEQNTKAPVVGTVVIESSEEADKEQAEATAAWLKRARRLAGIT